MLTADQFSQLIIAQARILDPSFSGEIGTPERKIIDSVAQNLANNQIDLTGLGAGLNIDSKIGSNLDSFTATFGMQRQQATIASGFIIYSRNTPAPVNVGIPQGSLMQATNLNPPNGDTGIPTIQYTTQTAGVIPQGATHSAPIPVRAVITGSIGNVPANSLTTMVGAPIAGVTAVTNPVAISNGLDAEDDNSFKTRFQNTWARNLAGTTSQYLALALAGAFTTKANCIGQQSVYREYIQVPDFDDGGYLNGGFYLGESTYGNGGEWTSALSDIPYAKQIYTSTPSFISNDQASPTYFYRPNADFTFNYPPNLSGDALRDSVVTQGLQISCQVVGGPYTIGATPINIQVDSTAGFPPNATLSDVTVDDNAIVGYGSISATTFRNATSSVAFTINTGDILQFTQDLPTPTLYVESVNDFPTEGTLVVGTDDPPIYQTVFYSGVDLDNQTLLNCISGEGIVWPGTNIYLLPKNPQVPNFTFLNIFNPITDLSSTGLQVLHPGDVVLSEYSYVSTASRNDLAHNIDNAVDLYVDGSNDVQASTIFLPNVGGAGALGMFNDNPGDPYYIENYRRHGQPTKRPQVGNFLTPLYQAPINGLPDQIQVAGQTFYEGWHYWLVNEVDYLGGSIRARDGIEWNVSLVGDTGVGPPIDPLAPYVPTPAVTPGNVVIFSQPDTLTPVEVKNYLSDANIVTMQAACEQSKQITTDVLVHKAQMRYFKFYLTLQYAPQQSPAVVNAAVQIALQAYLANQYFGTVIQLSSVLEAIASVTGVQNARWSNDTPQPTNHIRVVETDINGVPLAGALVDRLAYGAVGSNVETQTLYFVGNPSGFVNGIEDTCTLTWTDASSGNGGHIPTPHTFGTQVSFFDPSTSAPVSDTDIQASIQNAAVEIGATGMYSGITVTEDLRSPIGVADPIRSFTITYSHVGTPVLPAITNNVTDSEYVYDTDFFLLDDQLPSLPLLAQATDTLPGLVITTRAQNTWLRNA